MQIDFLSVLITVLSLVALAVPGFILAKMKLLPEKASEACTTIVLYVSQTALVFMGFQGQKYDPEIGKNMLIAFGLGVLIHLVMVAIMYLCIGNKGNNAKKNVIKYAGVFGNCGFMGMPFLKMLFPNNGEVMIYCAVVLTVFNILNWTVGVYMISGDKKQISIKKVLLNPVIICVVLGFLVFIIAKEPLVDLAVPESTLDKALEAFMGSVNLMGNMVTPLSMTVIGMRLANVNIKQLFLDKGAYIVSFLKLVVMSVVTMLIVAFLPIDTTVKASLFFLFSMPSAASTAMFAIKFNGDGDFGSVVVLLSTILSILIIPLMFLVFTGVFGIVINA